MYDEDEDLNLDDDIDDAEDEDEEIEDLPMEVGIDFETGQMTGGKVTGKKAVAVWAWNALKTPRYQYEQHSWQYGSELNELIGQAMDEEDAEIMAESMVRDALLINPHIEDISDFKCELDADKLTISFILETSFGEEAINDVVIQ